MFSQFQIKSRFVIMCLFCIGFASSCYTHAFESTEHDVSQAGKSINESAGTANSSGGSSAGSSQIKSTGGLTTTFVSTSSAAGSTSSSTRTSVAGASGGSSNATCPSADLSLIKIEADYIRKCQYLPTNTTDPDYGSLSHSVSDSTTIIPSEVAMASIALAAASKALNDSSYLDAANKAADYLARIPDKIYGGWHDQYNRGTSTSDLISVNQTAYVMILFQYLGFQSSRATVMNNAAGFILSHQSVNNKGGADDGLLCKGRDAKVNFIGERWTSDNALGYLALKGAAAWSGQLKDTASATEYETSMNRILGALNSTMLDASGTHWKRMINQDGTAPSDTEMTADWISYSPALFNLPLGSVSISSLGTWIHQTLQTSNGAVVWDNSSYRARQSPKYSFEASLIWKKAGQCAYVNDAMKWTRTSDLWDSSSGGWIDWSELSGNQAATTSRSIETSAYAILNSLDSFSFSP